MFLRAPAAGGIILICCTLLNVWVRQGKGPEGRKSLAQGARSCERIGGGEGPLSRSAAILRVLPTAAETDYGHDI
jgi:hypothetical protein